MKPRKAAGDMHRHKKLASQERPRLRGAFGIISRHRTLRELEGRGDSQLLLVQGFVRTFLYVQNTGPASRAAPLENCAEKKSEASRLKLFISKPIKQYFAATHVILTEAAQTLLHTSMFHVKHRRDQRFA